MEEGGRRWEVGEGQKMEGRVESYCDFKKNIRALFFPPFFFTKGLVQERERRKEQNETMGWGRNIKKGSVGAGAWCLQGKKERVEAQLKIGVRKLWRGNFFHPFFFAFPFAPIYPSLSSSDTFPNQCNG